MYTKTRLSVIKKCNIFPTVLTSANKKFEKYTDYHWQFFNYFKDFVITVILRQNDTIVKEKLFCVPVLKGKNGEVVKLSFDEHRWSRDQNSK